MDVKSLLSAAFLYLQGEEQGTGADEFFNNFTTDDIIEIAKGEGHADLANAFEKCNKAANDMSSACTGGELEDAEREFYKQREFIEQNI